MLGVLTMNNSSLEFSPLNWLSLVPGLNRRFALKYITVENTNFKGNVMLYIFSMSTFLQLLTTNV